MLDVFIPEVPQGAEYRVGSLLTQAQSEAC
jgi:hypothetical protein